MSAKIRRRSAAVSLSAVVLGGALAACEPKVEDQPMKVYGSAGECAAAGEDWNACNTSAQSAEAEHIRTAPRFASQDECLRETGSQCMVQGSPGGTQVFLPLMAGFMMGQMLNRGYVGHPLYAGRDGYYSGRTQVYSGNGCDNPGTPQYENCRRAGGSSVARVLPRQISAPMDSKGEIARPGSARRGGFGRTSGFRGTGG